MMSVLYESLEKKVLINPGSLEEAYNEPHRHYHTLDHVEHILEGVEIAVKFYKLTEFEESILHTLAWFHDVVYDPKSDRNEEDSANLFYQLCETDDRFGYLSGTVVDSIYDIIIGTKSHKTYSDPIFLDGSATFLGVLFFDLDLRGLGTTAYQENAEKVRMEFSHLSDEEWTQGRIKFLESMLDRVIFHTSLYAPLERLARQNLATELIQLKGA